jgi:Uma2 family endonuclease
MARVDEELMTLARFLELPETKPALEFIDGKVIPKMSPKRRHSMIQIKLGARLDRFLEQNPLGVVFTELRCTYGGDSFVPDLCFIASGRTPRDESGNFVEDITFAPDLAIEILSESQTIAKLTAKFELALNQGLRLGWLIDPARKTVRVFRPGREMFILEVGARLLGEDVLPGFDISLDDMFAWLKLD